ncbi:MAG: MBL fold metallo-hydrolase [Deltaproteobacteria bacterium]|nr:MBL fold metallo-hydrolase [Deltaproteobacteria bacterium]
MTTITEIAPDIYRICTFISDVGMQFNQFLVRDREPLLYHTGMKAMFPIVRDAIAKVIDPATLRWISFSHFESDECGALNEFLSLSPGAQPLCSFTGAMVSVNDFALRAARGLRDDEVLTTGTRRFRLIRTPHLPHNWEASHLFEESTRTLFCSDLFHQDGELEPMTTSASELMKRVRNTLVRYQAGPFSDYLPFTPMMEQQLARLAALKPEVLAAMHGSAFKGSAEHALHELSKLFREVLAGC